MIFPQIDTFRLNSAPRLAPRVSNTEVTGPVEAFFAPTDPVVSRWAFRFHFLAVSAEVVAVQTPGQVVPQLREVVTSARRTLGGRGGGAVRGHVRPWWTFVTSEGYSCHRVPVLKGGNGSSRRGTAEDGREQDQHRYKELRREGHGYSSSKYPY